MMDAKENGREITIYINGEAETVVKDKMTVREIIELVGFEPANEYRLIRENGGKEYTDPDMEIPVHKDEHFKVMFKGATQVS